mgnify:CR=1 FL=1
MNRCPTQDLQSRLRTFLRKHADDLPPAPVRAATAKSKLGHWTVYCDRKGIVGALPYLFAGMTAAAYVARAQARGRSPSRPLPLACVLPAGLVLLGVLVILRNRGGDVAMRD